MLDDKLKALWARISPPQKAAFFGCFLSGYLVHLYVFTNIIPNSDGLSRIFDPQQMTVSGRWFLHFASYFNGFTQMPAVIGLFSVLFLAQGQVCSYWLTRHRRFQAIASTTDVRSLGIAALPHA